MFFIWKRAEAISVSEPLDLVDINIFDLEIFDNLGSMNIRVFFVLASVYLGLAVVSLVLRDIYFIDAILSAVPFAVTAYMWSAGTLTMHSELAVTVAAVYFAVRLISALSGRAYPKCVEKA